MVTFQAVSMNASFNRLRAVYLDSLSQPQELYVEMQVAHGRAFLILRAEKTVGYLILSSVNTLMEFHLNSGMVPHAEIVFGSVLDHFKVTRVCCKSYDSLLLKCGLAFSKKTKVVGTLFRDLVPSPLVQPEEVIETRMAERRDIPEIQKCREGLFETDQEVNDMVGKGSMLVFTQGGATIGWGLFNRVIPERPDVDVGMLVHPDHRKRGVGTYIIQYLREYCVQNLWRPICGCAKQNVSSRKTLERAGFVSKYDLLEFEF